MPTTNVVSGRALRLYLDTNAVAYATEFTYNESAPITERDHKDLAGGGYADPTTGNEKKTIEITSSALFAFDGANNDFFDLRALLAAGTTVAWKIDTTVSGDKTLAGNAVVTSIDLNAAVGEDASFSVTLAGKGAPSEATNV